jgi:aminoglycoside phosphotransferase (APT) family kinase protein
LSNYEDFQGTRAVAEAHRFDLAALEHHLREHMSGLRAPIEVEQFKGGQSNPTFLLKSGDERYVLRRKPPGKLLPSAHAVDREHRVIGALAASGVPVARTHYLCTDESVIGSMFYACSGTRCCRE